MQVQVIHGLPTIRTGIRDNPKAIRQLLLLGNLRGGQHQVPQ